MMGRGSQAQPASTRPVQGAHPSLAGNSALGPFGVSVITASLAFLVAGIVMPEASDILLRLLLVTLAGGYVVFRAYDTRLPARATGDVYSPFDHQADDANAAVAPRPVRDLAGELAAADDARQARRTEIPRSVRWSLIDEIRRRLSHEHGLSFADSEDHPKIRSLISEATWWLIAPGDAEPPTGAAPPGIRRFVSLSQLHRILDDLERL